MKFNTLLFIVFALCMITLNAEVAEKFMVKPLASESKNLVVTSKPAQKCSDVKLYFWAGKDFPTGEIEYNAEAQDKAQQLSFKGFPLTKLQADADNEKDAVAKKSILAIIADAKTVSGCKAARFGKKSHKKSSKRLQKRSSKKSSKRSSKKSCKSGKGKNCLKTKASSNVYLLNVDASAIVGEAKTRGYPDANKQYFEDGIVKKEYWTNILAKTPKWNIEPTLATFRIDFPGLKAGDMKIKAVQIYTRSTGVLPKDSVVAEMAKAKANPTTHVPSTYDAFKYFVMKVSVPEGNQHQVKHSILEFCSENNGQFDRFVVDRGSRESALSDTWQSRVRFAYVGKATSCDLTSGTWLNDEVSKVDGKSTLDLVKGGLVKDVGFEQLIRVSKEYLQKFPVYNTLVNCQHYAYNVFNLFSENDIDFEAAEIMGDHADKADPATSSAIAFDPKLTRFSRQHKLRHSKRQSHYTF